MKKKVLLCALLCGVMSLTCACGTSGGGSLPGGNNPLGNKVDQNQTQTTILNSPYGDESYMEFMEIDEDKNGILTRILDQMYLLADAYDKEYVESISADDIFPGFTDLSCTALHIYEEGDYLVYELEMHDLQKASNLTDLQDIGILELSGMFLNGVTASSYIESLEEKGFEIISQYEQENLLNALADSYSGSVVDEAIIPFESFLDEGGYEDSGENDGYETAYYKLAEEDGFMMFDLIESYNGKLMTFGSELYFNKDSYDLDYMNTFDPDEIYPGFSDLWFTSWTLEEMDDCYKISMYFQWLDDKDVLDDMVEYQFLDLTGDYSEGVASEGLGESLVAEGGEVMTETEKDLYVDMYL